MPYFQRTILFEPKFAIYFHQKTPECYGYCADWLGSCVANGNPFAWFDANFPKKQTIKKFDKIMPYCGEMTPDAKSRISGLYRSYSSNPTGGSVWGQILKGTGYQVEDSVNVPIDDVFSDGLSKTISGYKYGMIGWNYGSGRGIIHRNHQTAVMCSDEVIHFFDPNIGIYKVERNNFNQFFKKYYKDLIENEKTCLAQLGKSGFYDEIDIRGVSLIFT